VKSHQTEWPGDSSEAEAETVPGVAPVQARKPARREGGREFQALDPDAQKNGRLSFYYRPSYRIFGATGVHRCDPLT